MVEYVVRYGVRADPADRFSPLAVARTQAPERPAAFPQRPGALDAVHGSPVAGLALREDAHLAQISAPAAGAGLPVLFFVPGGGWVSGTGLARWYERSALVTEGHAVVVTVNYRLGIAGHVGPADSGYDGQRALRDLVCALRWVHDHIAAYGGDPGNITLAGDSAGAWYAYVLSTMPSLAGLFARTLLVSMPGYPPLGEVEYRARREHVVAFLADRGRSLRDASAEDLLDAQRSLGPVFGHEGPPIRATSAGEVRPDLAEYAVSAGRLTGRSLMALATSEESAAFLRGRDPSTFTAEADDARLRTTVADPGRVREWLAATRPGAAAYERAVALDSLGFQLPALGTVAGASTAGTPAYLLRWAVQSRQPRSYSPHCFPLPFLFGNRAAWRDAPMLHGFPDPEYADRSAELREVLVGFLRDGRPVLHGERLRPFDPASPTQLALTDDGPVLARPAEADLV